MSCCSEGIVDLETQQARFSKIIKDHYFRYPLMQVQDLYKLIYQAAMGSEHAITDEDSAWARLEQEVVKLNKDVRAPELEDLSPDGRIVRVNLRPYLLSGGDIERLFKAFMQTSKEFQGDERNLDRYATWAMALVEVNEISLSQGEFAEFFEQRRRGGHSAVHHSAVYKGAYQPAYRIVAQEYLRR